MPHQYEIDKALADQEELSLLRSFEGNGWLCPVTIRVAVEVAENSYEATDKVIAALTALGVSVRPQTPVEGS